MADERSWWIVSANSWWIRSIQDYQGYLIQYIVEVTLYSILSRLPYTVYCRGYLIQYVVEVHLHKNFGFKDTFLKIEYSLKCFAIQMAHVHAEIGQNSQKLVQLL